MPAVPDPASTSTSPVRLIHPAEPRQRLLEQLPEVGAAVVHQGADIAAVTSGGIGVGPGVIRYCR